MKGFFEIAKHIANITRQHLLDKNMNHHNGAITVQFVTSDKVFVKNYLGEDAENASFSFAFNENERPDPQCYAKNTALIAEQLSRNCFAAPVDSPNIITAIVKSKGNYSHAERMLYKIIITITGSNDDQFDTVDIARRSISAITRLDEFLSEISGEYCIIAYAFCQ